MQQGQQALHLPAWAKVEPSLPLSEQKSWAQWNAAMLYNVKSSDDTACFEGPILQPWKKARVQ